MKKMYILVIVIALTNLFVPNCDCNSGERHNHNNDIGATTGDGQQGDSNPSDTSSGSITEEEPDNSENDERKITLLDVNNKETVIDLHTEDDRDLGDVVVWNDKTHLYVKFDSTSALLRTYLAVESNLDSIPQTTEGNPDLCMFNFKTFHKNGMNQYTYKINIQNNNFNNESSLFIAAYALVEVDFAEENINPEITHSSIESTWGEGFNFPGELWATYFKYEITRQKYSIYYNDSLVASYNLPVVVNNRTAVDYYSYGDPHKESYNGDIILDESNVIQTFIIKDQKQEDYLVVVFDKALDGSGGAARVDLKSEGLTNLGLSFVVRDFISDSSLIWDDSLGTAGLDFKWGEWCTDGFVFGPLPKMSDYTLDLQLSSLYGLSSLKSHFTDEYGNLTYREISADLLDTIRFVYVK